MFEKSKLFIWCLSIFNIYLFHHKKKTLQIRERYNWPLKNQTNKKHWLFIFFWIICCPKQSTTKTITFIHISFLHIICIIVDFHFFQCIFEFKLLFTSCCSMTSGDVINFGQCQWELLSVNYFCLAKHISRHKWVHRLSSQFLLWSLHIICCIYML